VISKTCVATKVRTLCERWNTKHKKFGSDLACMCAIASSALTKAFHKAGYKKATLIEGEFDWGGHCWVELDGEIWDITATQFGIDNEVHRTSIDDEDYHDRIKVDFKEWPPEQKPNSRIVKEILQ